MKNLTGHLIYICVVFVVALNGTDALARKKSKVDEKQPFEAEPEMRIDPNLINSYQEKAAIQSEKVEQSGVQILAIEPGLDFHQLTVFKSHNDYFDIPLSGGSKTAIAPSVWVGNPVGAVWFAVVRVRIGVDASYLGYDGAQTVHQRDLNLDFRDNISAHVFPVIVSAKLGTATKNEYTLGLSPWISLGSGMMLTQVAGNLDGTSQSGWSPVSKMSGGLRYLLSGQNGILGGVSAGVFKISGSSKKAEWQGSGVTVGADVFL